MCKIVPFGRQAIRAALKIHGHLAGTTQHTGLVPLPEQQWAEVAAQSGRFELALRRGWRAASDHVLLQLEYALRRLRSELDECHDSLPRFAVPSKLVRPRDIYEDLLVLQQEFDGLVIDLQKECLEVETEPIVLEDTAFGSFRIVLHWESIGSRRPYEVIAKTPFCPREDSDVTHPHVRGNHLCEGEGAAAIRSALSEGRLLDFFTLVRQVLETYNGSSAYVPLERWEGVACGDCGWHMPEDESSSCDRCEDPLCHDCSTCCGRCDRYLCSGCSFTCTGCESRFCERCLAVSAGSDLLVCESCYDQTLEQESHETPKIPKNGPIDSAEGEVAARSAPAADAVCLGEAAVPP